MKGAPPRLPYLISLFPTLSKAGATDLLLEYEDMFPFWGPLANISARNAYTIQDIASLLHAAKENNMTVIPLVQTFGHMEWLLKLERFKHLREEPHYPGSVCPSREGTMDLLRLVSEAPSCIMNCKPSGAIPPSWRCILDNILMNL